MRKLQEDLSVKRGERGGWEFRESKVKYRKCFNTNVKLGRVLHLTRAYLNAEYLMSDDSTNAKPH